ncbi:MAG: precorrin-3B C(17)-methyltransferase [Rhodospirillales bacterium]
MTAPVTVAVTAVVILDETAAAHARRLVAAMPDAELHARAGRVAGADVEFEDTASHLRALYNEGRAVIAFCAAGIVIRALAPVLAQKQAEPPVVCVSHDGGYAVPLLGGHRGANKLAHRAAQMLAGRAAVTTASDTAFGFALDDPPPGWRLANPESAKGVTAALLGSGGVFLDDPMGVAGWMAAAPWRADEPDAPWRADKPDAPDESEASAARFIPAVRVTAHAADKNWPAGDMIFHPPVLTVGVGCERGAPADALIETVRGALNRANLAEAACAVAVSLDIKMDEPAVHALGDALGVPARFYDARTLEAESHRLKNPSDVVFAETGCHGVAEGAALAAAGPGGVLLIPKTKGPRVTCAVALAPGLVDAAQTGRAQGSLTLVGLGPGSAEWRTPAADAAVAAASDVVGYGPYLDLIADKLTGKACHKSDLTHEESRARLALDLAATGRRVALLGSGDAGIYALGALVFELLDREGAVNPAWLRVAVETAPGVSAMQAAAARIGAPLGHDFCAVSLSDLLTPWDVIEKRLRAAAEGDFVVALYNPVSVRRREQLGRARDILITGRGRDAPVALARNLGRAGEAVKTLRLGDLTADDADMLTVVVIGASSSRVFEHAGRTRIYTPRGYAEKSAQKKPA